MLKNEEEIQKLAARIVALESENRTLQNENSLLKSALGRDFRASDLENLPPSVLEDFNRRIAMGLEEQTALQCALRQFQHDEKLKTGATAPAAK
jgi:hypothetical protein